MTNESEGYKGSCPARDPNCGCDHNAGCAWCGKTWLHDMATMGPNSTIQWCQDSDCREKHKAANPHARHWRVDDPAYWTPIEETLPGGKHDGVWENSGFTVTPDD